MPAAFVAGGDKLQWFTEYKEWLLAALLQSYSPRRITDWQKLQGLADIPDNARLRKAEYDQSRPMMCSLVAAAKLLSQVLEDPVDTLWISVLQRSLFNVQDNNGDPWYATHKLLTGAIHDLNNPAIKEVCRQMLSDQVCEAMTMDSCTKPGSPKHTAQPLYVAYVRVCRCGSSC